jgi:hypothetical protein
MLWVCWDREYKIRECELKITIPSDIPIVSRDFWEELVDGE